MRKIRPRLRGKLLSIAKGEQSGLLTLTVTTESVSLLPLFETARVLVRLDHVSRCIVNANHGIMRATLKLRITNRMANF